MAKNEIRTRLTADGKGFASVLGKAQGQANRWAATVGRTIAGAFAIGAMIQATRATVEWGGRMEDLAKQTNVSTEKLQVFEFIARKTGTSLESITNALGLLSKARNDAIAGLATKKRIFAAIGITDKDLKDLNIEQLFDKIAEIFRTMDFGAAEGGIARELFGNNGIKLLTTFKEGMALVEQEARDANVISSDATLAGLAEIGDAFDRLKQQIRGPFAEAIVFVFGKMEALMARLKESALLVSNLIQVESEQRAPGGGKGGFMNFVKRGLKGEIPPDEMDRIAEEFAVDRRRQAGGQPRKNRGELTFREMIDEAIQRTAEMMAEDALNRKDPPPPIKRNALGDDFDALLGGDAAKAARFKPSSDSLARIGGFVGSSNRAITIQQQSLDRLKNIDKNINQGIKLRDGI